MSVARVRIFYEDPLRGSGGVRAAIDSGWRQS